MVPFAGYELPTLYKHGNHGGVMKEHLWCREERKCSLFDVSHMGQIIWHGKDRAKFLEQVVVGDIQYLPAKSSILSLLTNHTGGILDDTVITNTGNHLYMVVNGATKEKDIKHFRQQSENFEGDVIMETLDDHRQLLALQGPGAAEAVSKILPDNFNLKNMTFMTGTYVKLLGVENCHITRCGYTGEDGFELSIPAEATLPIALKFMEDQTVNLAGLGARDSLRLEAGLCLYGNDLNETITPTMAALGWTMGKPNSRRRKKGGFLGAKHILTNEGKFQNVDKKRVGIIGMKAPARAHTEIYDELGEKLIGEVTSGTYSPCLKAPIAMGYVETESAKNETKVMVKIREKMQEAKVTKMPFVEARYYRTS